MKALKLSMLLILLSSCNEMNSSVSEEREYQNFAEGQRKLLTKRGLMQPIGFENLELESGLSDFIKKLNDKNRGELNVQDLEVADQFYNEEIVKKYAGHDYQGYLKVKYISFAVYAFDLAPPAYPKAKEYLVKYTRDLIASRNSDPELAVKCLSSVKDLVDTMEYNSMLKNTDFSLRFLIENLESAIDEARNDDSPVAKSEAIHLESVITDLNDLRQQIEELGK